MSHSPCPPTELLREFLGGTLAPEQEQAVSDHIDQCVSCQDRLERLSSIPLSAPNWQRLPTAEQVQVESFLARVKAVTVPGTLPTRSTFQNAPVSMPVIPGYEILAELGRGGMGVVYKAIHRPLNRVVAVKMILSGLGPTHADRSRFKSEAEAIARLQHPNIVQLFEVGDAEGRPYLALEYVAGGNLQQRIADRPQHPRAAAGLIAMLARAVHAAHLQQLIHLDLKPGNVLLAPAIHPATDAERDFGIPKLTDFGLAKRLDHQHSTLSQVVSGTPSYMAPEQIPEGIAPGPRQPIGPGADIYALGAILYQLLTGRPPFLGPDWVTTLLQVVRRDPVPVRQLQPGVPRDLETICLKCLEKEPSRRYATANDLSDDLQRFLAGEPIRARPVGTAERFLKWARRRPVAAAAVGIAGLAVLSALVGLTVALAAVDAQRQAEARAASEARKREQAILKARIEADRLRSLADGNLYFSQIAQTNLLWRDHDVARARLTLAACAESFRAWEWSHLNRLCHDGLRIFSLPSGYRAEAVAADGGWYVAAGTASPAPGQPAPRPVIIAWNESGEERLRTLAPATGRPTWLSITPSGRRLTAVIQDSQDQERTATLCVWELPTTATALSVPPPLLIEPLQANWAVSDDGRWAIGIPRDHRETLRIWDLEAGTVLLNRTVSPRIRSVEISQDGTVIAWSDNDQIQVMQAATGKEIGSWAANEASSLTFNPTATQLAYYERSARSIVFQSVPPSDRRERRVAFDPGPLRSGRRIRFTPDGQAIIGLSSDGIRLYELANDRQTTIARPAGGMIRGLPSPDGLTVATIGDDGSVRVWPIASPRSGRMTPRVYRGHAGAVLAADFTDSGSWLVTGGEDGQVIVWDLTRPQSFLPAVDTEPAPSYARGIWLLPHGRLLELTDAGVHLWDPQVGIRLRSASLPHATADPRLPGDADYAPGANRLAVITPGRSQVAVYNLNTWTDPGSANGELPSPLQLIGHEYPITAVAISQDGSVIVTGSAGLEEAPLRPQPVGELCIWNGLTGALRQRIVEPGLCVCGLALAPDGRRTAVSCGWPGWDRAKEPAPPASFRMMATYSGTLGRPIASDRQGANPLVLMAVHPHGTSLAAIAYRRPETLQVYDLEEDRKLWEITAASPFTGLAYHPEGRRLAASGLSGVTLFDSETGAEALRLTGNDLETAFFSSLGHRVSFGYEGEELVCATTSRWVLWEMSWEPSVDRPRWRTSAARRSFPWHLLRLQDPRSTSYAQAFHAAALALPPGPQTVQDWLARARIRARQSRWHEAEADYAHAGSASLTPDDWLTLAAIQSHLAEKPSLAVPKPSEWPREPHPSLLQAQILLDWQKDAGDSKRDEAIATFIATRPQDPQGALLHALELIRKEEWKSARKVLLSWETRINGWPGAGAYWRLREQVHRKLEEMSAAEASRKQAEEWANDWGPISVPGVGSAPARVSAAEWTFFAALSRRRE